MRVLVMAGRIAVSLVVLAAAVGPADADMVLRQPQVEYRTTPLGIDVAQPRFSWHMAVEAGERGISPAAYRLEVRTPSGCHVASGSYEFTATR